VGRTTVEHDEKVRNELRSFKADHGLTYDEAVIWLLKAAGHDFRHLRPEDIKEK
jgi:hypothetical protein